jgi:hypothetical protein
MYDVPFSAPLFRELFREFAEALTAPDGVGAVGPQPGGDVPEPRPQQAVERLIGDELVGRRPVAPHSLPRSSRPARDLNRVLRRARQIGATI